MPTKPPPPASQRPGLLTLDEAAEYAQRSRWTLRDHVLKGRLPSVPIPGDHKRVYVRLEDVEHYLKTIRPGRPRTTDQGDNPA